MPRMHPHMWRHTFVTTMLDAGVSRRDVQIAARHADSRIIVRYDRADTRGNADVLRSEIDSVLQVYDAVVEPALVQ
jgi:integrase